MLRTRRNVVEPDVEDQKTVSEFEVEDQETVSEVDVEEFKEFAERLPNLQLLEGMANNGKRAALPAKWMADYFPDNSARTNYCDNHLLGFVPQSMAGFRAFYNERQQALRSRLLGLLGAKGVDA
jgi:hypothetical protein